MDAPCTGRDGLQEEPGTLNKVTNEYEEVDIRQIGSDHHPSW